jgi:hypothetical protein
MPAGFLTDFGSVPGAAKWFLDDDSPELLFPSVPHDFLYSAKGNLGYGQVLTRAQCDAVLLEAMDSIGAPPMKRQAVFRAVRLFGGAHWNQ